MPVTDHVKIIPKRVAERAATRFVISGECHISTYSIMSTGYAQIGWTNPDATGDGTLAHRAAWVFHNGRQLQAGETVDHRQADGCTSKRCVRKEHLRSLVNLENARRTNGWDWPLGTCRHGHGAAWWRPKSETRQKGYCHACRMVRQQTKRGTASRKVYA